MMDSDGNNGSESHNKTFLVILITSIFLFIISYSLFTYFLYYDRPDIVFFGNQYKAILLSFSILMLSILFFTVYFVIIEKPLWDKIKSKIPVPFTFGIFALYFFTKFAILPKSPQSTSDAIVAGIGGAKIGAGLALVSFIVIFIFILFISGLRAILRRNAN